jgi:GTP cyclohydrolase I
MVTSVMLGDFKANQSTRCEFFAHLERGDTLT